MSNYNPKEIELKWQKYWEEHPKFFTADDKSQKEKQYILDMFPYPSGDGLHVGHVESYTATDIVSRYLRMNGKNVLHPTGWDAFGLPAENYAIKTKTHPKVATQKNIATFKGQMMKLGLSYDWSREVDSSDPNYYKWTQWFFLLLYKNGLAYRAKASVNWCPKCQTVLANEQVIAGKCERCEKEVMQKDLEQWFFKITDFIEDSADKGGLTRGLLSGLNGIDWPESTKAAQRNWIGKSVGAIIKFPIVILNEAKRSEESRNNSGSFADAQDDNYLEVFTTRLDTIYGCTYCVVAPEQEIIKQYAKSIKNYAEIENYIIQAQNKTELERMELKDKTGVEIQGIKAINPFTKEKVPIFVADYVLGHYGTGEVMAVPAHDERDFEFAKKYNLPIKQSIAPLIVGKGKDIPIEGREFEKRNLVIAIVKHWEKDEYITLDWGKYRWRSFVVGGVEENESSKQAAIREMKEETGYHNIKKISKINGYASTKFYAEHKDVNRFAIMEGYSIELADGSHNDPEEEHVKNHKYRWAKKNEVADAITLDNHKWFWNKLIEGESAFIEDGTLVNSEQYNDLTSPEAREEMVKWLEKNNLGGRKINYKLRDWLISRQRYWGVPIPIIYCDKCGTVPVPEKDLPVVLPDDVDFNPTGESPLVKSKKFHKVKCPVCGEKARRESDTMDTFVCSSWYYFRYTDPKNGKEFASSANIKKWLPVDLYVGGAEHTVMHLLYSRFFTKVLHKLGYIDFDEPFLKLRHQGIILGEDSYKMSKSRGNVINPDDVIAEFGADALRMFEMFMGPLEDAKPWQTKGIIGIRRFLEKVWKLQYKLTTNDQQPTTILNSLLHKTIKKVTDDIENLRFNTAISSLMILVNKMEQEEKLLVTDYKLLITILSPFAPHIAEELWHRTRTNADYTRTNADKTGADYISVFKEKWPKYDPKLIKDEEIELVIQVNGKVRDRIKASAEISEEEAKNIALAREKVKNFIEGKEIKKVIFVKGKLINIVI